MAISGINTYAAATATTGTTTTSTKASAATSSNSSLSMDDFFTLLSAQMQNQTMFNPMQDTEFIGQMAQFSTLQQMQAISKTFASSMAASFIGKYVTAMKTDDSGQTVQSAGTVEKVDFTGDSPMLLVNGTWFTTSGIIDVQNSAPVTAVTTDTTTGTTTDTTTDTTGTVTSDGTETAADPAV